MNIEKTIVESLWLPVRNYKAVMKAFWPIIFFEFLLLIYSHIKAGDNSPIEQSIDLLVALFLVFLYVSAAVNWHRMLLLNKTLEDVKILPKKRELMYFIRLFIANFFTFAIAGILLIIPLLLFGKVNFFELAKSGILVSTIVAIAALILLSISIYIVAPVFMSLPASSIDTTSIKWPQRVSERFAWGKENRKTIAQIFFYSSLPNLVLGIFVVLISKIPVLGSLLNVPGYILSTFMELYWVLAFATGLSLIYKEYVLPELVEEVQKPDQENYGEER